MEKAQHELDFFDSLCSPRGGAKFRCPAKQQFVGLLRQDDKHNLIGQITKKKCPKFPNLGGYFNHETRGLTVYRQRPFYTAYVAY